MGVGWPPGSVAPDAGQQGATSGAATSWRDKYGRGRRHPVTGLYEWYEYPPELAQAREGTAVSWEQLLTRWNLIEADLHSEYGIDVEDRALMRHRTWRWLRARMVGLLSADTRIARALAPEPDMPDLPRH